MFIPTLVTLALSLSAFAAPVPQTGDLLTGAVGTVVGVVDGAVGTVVNVADGALNTVDGVLGGLKKRALQASDVDVAAVAAGVVVDANVGVAVVRRTDVEAVFTTLKSDVSSALSQIPLANVEAITAPVVAAALNEVGTALNVATSALGNLTDGDLVGDVPTLVADVVAEVLNTLNGVPASILADPLVAGVLSTVDGLLATVLGLVSAVFSTVLNLLNGLGVLGLVQSLGLSSVLGLVNSLGLGGLLSGVLGLL
ncbi:hypothetical protein DACRYDRAFT_24286 [Dacryopinax primogenitus]|uniref:Uncharacterized protein n=1 Tax=Dacryopinax primogenitus (strain DJM 731) TaxID=1858805 RepID=M5FTJ6_DACPD|nr:uncharacterized protein DACRYDRAFT_24286 [Dacryopinax primogenitus]EJT98704.1 hypothetical protein DACRYDRAFT_24286 [Dacryopinax primogenitus]